MRTAAVAGVVIGLVAIAGVAVVYQLGLSQTSSSSASSRASSSYTTLTSSFQTSASSSSSSASSSTTSFSSTSTGSSSTSSRSSSTSSSYPSLGEKFVEVKAFDLTKGCGSMGCVQFVAGSDYTATQLLQLIQSIHSAIGDFNLIRFVRVECQGGVVDPNLTAPQIQQQGYSGNANYNWNGTLNSYFSAIQKAAGGAIIPDGDLDIFYNDQDCDTAQNLTIQQAEQDYYQDVTSLLSLSAISNGPRYIMLESWDVTQTLWSGGDGNESTVAAFFQHMQEIGWRGFIPQINNPAATGNSQGESCSSEPAHDPWIDYGYAGYARSGIFWVNNTRYPYVFPHYGAVCSIEKREPYLNAVLIGLESQRQGSPADQAYCDAAYDSAAAAFSSCLSVSQQEQALSYLAANQNNTASPYIFIYPVLIGEHSVEYDAQQAGTLGMMEQLINQYN